MHDNHQCAGRTDLNVEPPFISDHDLLRFTLPLLYNIPSLPSPFVIPVVGGTLIEMCFVMVSSAALSVHGGNLSFIIDREREIPRRRWATITDVLRCSRPTAPTFSPQVPFSKNYFLNL